jgi:Ca-activated chloride channel homolog
MNRRNFRILTYSTLLALIVGLISFGLLSTSNRSLGMISSPNVAWPTSTTSSPDGSGVVGLASGQTPAMTMPLVGRTDMAYEALPPSRPLSDRPYPEATPGTEPDIRPVLPTPVTNPFVETVQDKLSTFALDVDTGSYTAVRNYIMDGGNLPPAGMVRPEEFINYFRYGYKVPEKDAFGLYVDSAPSPFNQNTHIVRVGVQAKNVTPEERKDAVLTFVIDVSGSMDQPDRLPLVKEALRLLVDELRPNDKVGIVVYGSEARLVLEHTSLQDKGKILSAIDSLENEGSTNAEAGLKLGYELASKGFKVDAINRVVLCSDGVANVGATSPDDIRAAIREYSEQGVYLTTVGFGMGDYNDHLMEQLADDGDGQYAYVDSLAEAKRIFVENLTGTLQVVAKDAKIQVDFNPAVVKRYRLVGYENRDVADIDFRNDKVDAGDIGAGHTVTALYEVELTAQAETGDALTVQMRYLDPKSKQATEIAQPFALSGFGKSFDAADARFRLAVAVASFAETLKGSEFVTPQSHTQVLAIAERAYADLGQDSDVGEFVEMVRMANTLR